MKDKRRILLAVILSICQFFNVSAQTTDSTVVLRGYVVQQFDKQEVLDSFTLKNKKSISIDSYEKIFFCHLEKGV